jgi:aquaglyceroporin related protein
MLGIYVGGGVSGAHMIPTISFTLSVYRRFPWRQCITYTLVQLLAGLIAGALAFGAFRDTIYQVDPGLETKWNAFCSMPRDGVGIGNAVLA